MSRPSSRARRAWLTAFLASVAGSCGPEAGHATTAALGRVWAESEGFELVGGADWGLADWGLAEALGGLPGPAGARGTVRLVAGPPEGAAVADLLGRLPVETVEREGELRTRFRCLDRLFDWREAAVVATLEDPERPGRPLVVATSQQETRASAALREVLAGPEPWRPRLAVFVRGEVVLAARLDARGAARAETTVDHGARRRWDELGEVWETDEAWSWRPAPGRVALVSWESALRGVLPGLAWAGVAAPSRMEILMAPTVDALVGVRPAQRGARYDPRERRLVWGWPATDGPLAFAAELLVAELGAPPVAWLARAAGGEAAAPGEQLLRACAEIARDACELEELLDPATPARSARLLDPQRALLWRVAREELGDGALRTLWRDPSGLRALASAWSAALDRVRALELEPVVPWERDDEDDAATWPPRAGAFVELPVAATGSLGSRACFAALERAREAGAELVVLRVHVAPPAAGADVHALEGDAAVLWAALMARTFDLEVALSAEILAAPSGVRAGGLVLTTPEEWRAHFDWTRRATEHVALLAQESGATALVLSGGAPENSRTVVGPDTEEPVARIRRLRDEGWRDVLRTVRGRFDGRVVLACARTEGVGFLDELDAVLVELFPASPRGGSRGGGERRARLFDARVEEALDAHPRTILDVGFRARANLDPGPQRAGGASDPEAQRALFAALAATLERRATRGAAPPAGVWVRGFGAAPGEPDPRGYALEERPAAELLPALWR